MSHIAFGLAALCLTIAVPALFNQKKFREAMAEFFDAPRTTLRGAGFANLIIAFFIFNTHWTVKLNESRSIMTVLAYLLVFRGIMCIWFTDAVRTLGRTFLKKSYSGILIGFIHLALAVGLGYLGRYVF